MGKSVAILHGWAGGHWSTKRFEQALNQAGFNLTEGAPSADIIFAHSTGCYIVPDDNQAELIVLHGIPYWPRRPLLLRLIHKKSTDTKHLLKHEGTVHVLVKSFWELIYIFKYPSKTWVAVSQNKKLDFLDNLRSKKVLMIRNQKDNFCSPNMKSVAARYANISYVEIPGLHDDYYTNPEPYIDLIRKEL